MTFSKAHCMQLPTSLHLCWGSGRPAGCWLRRVIPSACGLQDSGATGEAAPQPSPAQLVGATAAAAMVFVQEKADNFVQLMLTMDKPSISLESKWADLQQLGNEDIG